MDTATPSTPAPPGIAERVRSVLIAMASSTLIPDVAGAGADRQPSTKPIRPAPLGGGAGGCSQQAASRTRSR
jgi:hypothetical protein